MQNLPSRVAQAESLWRDGYTSTRSRVAFEDMLFELKSEANELGLDEARDVIAALEAFVITVPLVEEAARAADPGVRAALQMLDVMRYPNVSIHFGALFRLLRQLARNIRASERSSGEFRPIFVPPRTRRDDTSQPLV